MLARIRSAAVLGIDAYVVDVETDIANGLPTFQTVGLPQGAVKEGRERVYAAIANTGYTEEPVSVGDVAGSVHRRGTGDDRGDTQPPSAPPPTPRQPRLRSVTDRSVRRTARTGQRRGQHREPPHPRHVLVAPHDVERRLGAPRDHRLVTYPPEEAPRRRRRRVELRQ